MKNSAFLNVVSHGWLEGGVRVWRFWVFDFHWAEDFKIASSLFPLAKIILYVRSAPFVFVVKDDSGQGWSKMPGLQLVQP